MSRSAPLLDLRQHPELRLILVGFALFLLFAAICYWSMPSLVHQGWDSLENAYEIENNPIPLRWGNHPLGHLIQSLIYRVAIYFGYDDRALRLLQIVNVLATAAAVVTLFVILVRRMAVNITQAAGWATFFGSGYSIIYFAGIAEIYSLSLLLLLIAWNSVLLAVTRPEAYRLIVAGVLIGVAGLAHQFSGILLGTVVVMGFFYLPRKSTVILVGVMLSTLVLGYGLLAYLATDSLAPGELFIWIRKYVGESSFGRSFSLEGVRLAMDSGTQSLIKGTETGSHLLRTLLLGIIALILISLPLQRRLWTFARIQTGLYCAFPVLIGVLLIIWWDPVLEGKWWLLVAPFLTAMLALGLPDNRRWVRFVPMSLALSVLLINQLGLQDKHGLQYIHNRDLVFERSLQAWVDHSSPGDVLYESKMFTEHLLYLANRPETISAHLLIYDNHDIKNPYRPLEKAIKDAWDRGASVLYTNGLNEYYDDDRLAVVGASRDGLDAFFRAYGHEGPVFEYRETLNGPLKQVFRLVPPISREPDS